MEITLRTVGHSCIGILTDEEGYDITICVAKQDRRGLDWKFKTWEGEKRTYSSFEEAYEAIRVYTSDQNHKKISRRQVLTEKLGITGV